MAGKAVRLVMLMLTTIVLSNSEDQVFTTRSPRLWTGLISTLSPLTTKENHGKPGESEAAPVTDELTTVLTEYTHHQETVETMASAWTDGTVSTGPETTLGATIKTFKRGRTACTTFTIVAQGVMPVLVSAAGLLGNTVCILVFWNDRHKSATYTLLLQLAVCDTIVLITLSVQLMSQAVYYNSDHLDQDFLNAFPYMRKYGWGICNAAQMVACWLVVVITAQRHIAVCHSHKMCFLGKPRYAWIILAILLVICIPFNLMRWLEFDVIILDGEAILTYSEIGTNTSYQIYFMGVAYYFLIFVAPVSLLLFFTVALILKLRKSKMKVTVQPSANPATTSTDVTKKQTNNQSSTDEITFALIVVDIVFIVCQTVTPLRRLLDYLGVDYRSCTTAYSYLRPMSAVFVAFNSAFNFVVFCLCAKGFRSQVFERVCGKLNRGGNNSVNSLSTKQTTARGAPSSKI